MMNSVHTQPSEEYHRIMNKFKKESHLNEEEEQIVGYFVSTNKLSNVNIRRAIELGKVNKLFEFYQYCSKSPLHIPMSFDKWIKAEIPSDVLEEEQVCLPRQRVKGD